MNFMISTKVQPYAEYSMSKIAGEKMDEAIRVFAQMINAKENEILIGGSTSNNLYVLSNALKKFIEPGDEIINPDKLTIIPVVIEIMRELKKDSKNFSLIKDK